MRFRNSPQNLVQLSFMFQNLMTNRIRRARFPALILAIFLLQPLQLFAHAQGEHYVWIGVEETALNGEVEISSADLNALLGFDIDPTRKITEAVLERYKGDLLDYFQERFAIEDSGGVLPLEIQSIRAKSFKEGNYASIKFVAGDGRQIDPVITVTNRLLVDKDPRHRGLLLITYNRRTGAEYRERTALVFGAYNTVQALDLDNPPGLLSDAQFVIQGILHILWGIDHVLFLVSLLFTAVLVRTQDGWQPVAGFKPALWKILKIVTLFTIAHSITLFLAGLGYLQLSGRIVEPLIALSIIVVAANNLLARFDSKKYWIILVFGLFHGLGFASVMSELPFRMQNLLSVVFYFNLGVELGQILLVAAVFPVLYLTRNSSLYRPVVVVGGSLGVAAVAAFWFFERVT